MITVSLIRFYFFLFTSTLLSGSIGYAQQQTIHTMYGKSVEPSELTEGIKTIMEQHSVPGLSIAVINNNELVYHSALGYPILKQTSP